MVLWGTVAEQYRITCGELEARPAAVIKKVFVHKTQSLDLMSVSIHTFDYQIYNHL